MKYLLDTNVLSDLRRGRQPVVAWMNRHVDDDLVISSVTVMELERGILRLTRRDPRQGKALRRWFAEQVLPEFAHRTLPIDTQVALRAAALHVPDPRPSEDAYLAATALVHDLTVVTRNVHDFARTGARVVDPWAQVEGSPS